ncbi:MAG TPA: Rid family hydrolase [Jatrophihabitantaceae bacterium]|nr:Rid family hydrolase [Jatrophihabitantaceae bacterium]
MHIERVASQAPYTARWGYSRAIRIGDRVLVSGTSATKPDGSVYAPGDAYEQTRYVLDLIQAALRDVGASLEDVVSTRAYLTTRDIWPEVGRAHLEHFGATLPTSTCIAGIELLQPQLLVEIEAEAITAVD